MLARYLHPLLAASAAVALLVSPASAQPATVFVQTGHPGGILTAAFTPDGRTLISGALDKTIKFWDVASGRERRPASLDYQYGARTIVVSPTGRHFATIEFINTSNAVTVWDVATGSRVHTLSGHAKSVYALAFSPDGKLLASGGGDNTVKLWDVASGTEKATFTHSGFQLGVRSVAFSPDGLNLAAGLATNHIAIWDIGSGKQLQTLRGHAKEVSAVAYAPDGKQLVSGSRDKSIRFWNLASGKETRTLAAAADELGVDSVAFSPDGRFVLSSSQAKTQLWDVASGKERYALDKLRHPVFSPDGHSFLTDAVCCSTASMRLWDTETGKELRSFNGYGTKAYFEKASPNGRMVAAENGSTLAVWDIVAGKRLTSFPSQEGERIPLEVAFVHDGLQAWTVGQNNRRLEVWDVFEKKARNALEWIEPTANPRILAFSPDGKLAAYSTATDLILTEQMAVAKAPKYTVSLRDIQRGKTLHTLQFGQEHIEALLFSRDGRTLATASGKTIRLWDTASGKVLAAFADQDKNISRLAFSADDKKLASADEDGILKLWNVGRKLELSVTQDTGNPIYAMAFSADGTRLATGGREGAITLWDAVSGSRLRQQNGHAGAITNLGFSADGKRIISSSWDKTLRVWRAADGAELGSFIQLNEEEWVVITPEGYFNASSYEAANAINVASSEGADSVRGVAEFWDVFYRPDLVHRKLLGEEIAKDTGGITLESALRKPPPQHIAVSLLDADPQQKTQVRLQFRITDAGGGIGEVRVFQNGKLVASDGLYRDAVGAQTDTAILARAKASRICESAEGGKTCEGKLTLEAVPGQENEISIIAFNSENTIQSLPARMTITSTLPKRDPHLWILPVGINQFSTAQTTFRELQNAAKDAEDFTRVYADKAKALFKPEHIHIVGGGASGMLPLKDSEATKANILDRLDHVSRQARPEDSFVWFVASHGTTSQGVFGIVPHDVDCQMPSCAQKLNLISSNDILEKSKAIRAMNQLFIFDTCQSGALDNKISGLYDARMATLAKNMGLHLYASAQATEHASDSDGKGNGLFTGQLLAGLSAAEADQNRDSLISIVELGEFAKRHTMVLSGAQIKRGATLVGASALPQALAPQTQTPLIMHFGRDANLVRITPHSQP